MKLNIGEAQVYCFAEDVNYLYPQVLWAVEIEDDRDLTDELIRPDIWNTAAVHNISNVDKNRYILYSAIVFDIY